MKVKIRKFLNLDDCQKFANEFCSKNDVFKLDIIPVSGKGPAEMVYIVVLQYS